MNILRLTPCAKVNLSLEVLGKRPDGFHEVRTIMQSISLADELRLEPAEGLSLECDPPDLNGEDNLALRAARALASIAEIRTGARMLLRKGIPTASGLGGASADAAAALVGLARLWGLEISPSKLGALAAELGSDVPFFLTGGTALASGRGEVIKPLPATYAAWLVLLAPPHSLSAKTAELYRRLEPGHWSSGERTDRLAEALAGGEPLREELLRNSFEAVADRVFPELGTYRQALWEAGASPAHLSGAGPALFSLFETEASARAIAERLSLRGYRPMVARTLTREQSATQAISC